MRSNYYSGNGPVAMTANWNATTPSGTSIQVEVQDNSGTKVFGYSGDSKTLSLTSGYLYVYVRMTSTGASTPSIDDMQIALHSNAPEMVGIDIGDDGSIEWTSQGSFLEQQLEVDLYSSMPSTN